MRNMAVDAPSGRTSDDAVLDATRECILAVGVRRTTLTEVARRAGVSRMTVYRRWPDVASLVADLMTREFGALVAAAAPTGAAARSPARDRLVAHLVAGALALRANPLYWRIVDVDPELLLPYILRRAGSTQALAIAAVEEQIAAGQADGSVRAGDPALLARGAMLPVESFVLSAQVHGAAAPVEALAAELRALLDRYLRPGDG